MRALMRFCVLKRDVRVEYWRGPNHRINADAIELVSAAIDLTPFEADGLRAKLCCAKDPTHRDAGKLWAKRSTLRRSILSRRKRGFFCGERSIARADKSLMRKGYLIPEEHQRVYPGGRLPDGGRCKIGGLTIQCVNYERLYANVGRRPPSRDPEPLPEVPEVIRASSEPSDAPAPLAALIPSRAPAPQVSPQLAALFERGRQTIERNASQRAPTAPSSSPATSAKGRGPPS